MPEGYKMEQVNSQSPLVSVIIPVYNRAELLLRTLRSLINQTYRNLEIIVIDDGSSQEIKSIVDNFSDKRIKYLRYNVNRGTAEARNTGIRMSKGEFVEFLDSDDEYLPEKTEKQVEMFLNRDSEDNVGAVYCGMWMQREDSNTQRKYRLNYPKFCKWGLLLQQIMVKKDIIEKSGGFDILFPQADDTDIIFRLSRICRFAGNAEPLVILHKTAGSLSRNRKSCYTGIDLFLEKHSDNLSVKERSHWLYLSGKNSFYSGKCIKGYKAFIKSFFINPLNIKSLRKLIRLFPVFLFHLLRNKK